MYAIPNVMNKVLPLLAVIDAKIATAETAIGVNATATGVNATAIATNASAIAAKEFIDRGDIDSYDFVTGDFTEFYAWADLDLHAIVGEASRLVLLEITIEEPSMPWAFSLRTKGNTNDYNIQKTSLQVVNVPITQSVLVLTNADGVIQYNTHGCNFDTLNVAVCGWFVL